MDESPTGCWTNHHSIIEYNGQWYLFYHHNDLSPKFDKNRSTRIDSLFFNPDGTIQKVVPTLRGVGVSDARKEIQLDRYSRLSDTGAGIDFIDSANTFKGWKTVLNSNGAYVQYNSVDFGNGELKTVKVKASSTTGGKLLVRTGSPDGTVIAEINVPQNDKWNETDASLTNTPTGVRNLFVSLEGAGAVEIDWIKF
jgi:hypothetical protein